MKSCKYIILKFFYGFFFVLDKIKIVFSFDLFKFYVSFVAVIWRVSFKYKSLLFKKINGIDPYNFYKKVIDITLKLLYIFPPAPFCARSLKL